ncbi:hypothetical protein BDV59DRAFT_63511 [Aspergillus ambiguus]|uniref:uncharacterized protein n=1 Tax=Aspergillus ambiguus TaxID=176160 RepID=UPI003CCD1991
MASGLTPWIGPLVDQCLSSLISGKSEESKVDNDGRNVRFTIRSQQSALINSWTEGERPIPNLSDSKTQISANLSQDSVSTYRTQFPNNPLNKDVKGYTVELYDFDVVFDYSASRPDAFLYVKRFAIAWDRGKFKGPPLGKKLRKHPPTALAMNKAVEKFKPRTSDPAIREATGPNLSQHDGPSQAPATQGLPLSQAQTYSQTQTQEHLILNAEVAHVNYQANGAPSADSLLGHLAARETPDNEKTPIHDATEIEINSQPSTPPGDSRCSGPGPVPTVHYQTSSASPSKSEIPTGQAPLAPESEHIGREAEEVTGMDADLGQNREVERGLSERPVTQLAEQSDLGDSAEHLPRLPQKTDGTKKASDAYSRPNQIDPWSGMGNILKHDITVPRNQRQFFESDRRVWVPPPPGAGMPPACVPSELLSQWNHIVLQRARSKTGVQPTPESAQDRPSEPIEPTSDAAESSSESEDEHSSGTTLYSWSTSSVRSVRPALPADSSPVKSNSKQKSQSPQIQESGTQVDRAQTNGAMETTPTDEDESNKPQDTALDKDAAGEPETDVNGVSCTQKTRHTSARTTLAESDAESEDSVMDTSVPCPLVGSSQAYPASQSDQEVSSSGPPLPETSLQERVQVFETPAANHRRLPLNELAKGDERNNYKNPPQEGKSSSQSRIFNTYASHDGADMDTQDAPQASQVDSESHHVDIMGTQLSNVALPAQGALPFSSSAVPNSTYQSDTSSKPFSSHNEIISSIKSEEKLQMAFDSSAPDLSTQDIAPSPLKRPASEVGTESHSISKRHRVDKTSLRRRESTLPVLNVVSRRESYITQTKDAAEAQRVFEKFRNDYPSYGGDFAHFTELCSKLEALRSRDCLTRSFLWDDFVIKHLEAYVPYREEHLSQESKVPSYEEFFLSNYNKPSYKKRSLTAGGIKKATSQHIPADGLNTLMDTSPLRNGANTSFTGSLVARFSNFHAHSFGPEPQDTASASDRDIDQMSIATSSPIEQSKTGQQASAREENSDSDNELFVRADSPGFSASLEPESDPSDQQVNTGPVIPETESENENESGNESSGDGDMMDETHETASLELGDGTGSDSDEEENWFVSLRHIRESGAGWWNDPNTPLKEWAKADQNVRSERVYRKDWRHMPVDQKGVIQPRRLGL